MGTPTRFGQFARALRELSRVPSDVARTAAPAITKIMRRSMRGGLDPYQRQYAPLTESSLARGRRPPPLRRMARTMSAKPMRGAGIAMHADHPQAGFHQTGTSRMVARIVLPDGVVPAAWRAEIGKAFKRALRARVSK